MIKQYSNTYNKIQLRFSYPENKPSLHLSPAQCSIYASQAKHIMETILSYDHLNIKRELASEMGLPNQMVTSISVPKRTPLECHGLPGD